MSASDRSSGSHVSATDIAHLEIIRSNVRAFMRAVAERFGQVGGRLLDIAPQDHEGARPYFPASVHVETLDIDPKAGATYLGDICGHNACLADGSFDFVVCTEVLEHTLNPFGAIAEIHRLLRPRGLLFLSVPFNFRIHGPLPDCWRFTEHGLRALLEGWQLEIDTVQTPDRFLMPIHYTVIARRGEFTTKEVDET
jgi:SAM-dependent methyltransferase